MVSKQSSFINAARHPSMLPISPSPASIVDKSNRNFLVFCAFLLMLLLGASLQRSSSHLPAYDRRAYRKAFIAKGLFGAASAISRARAGEDQGLQEKRRAELVEVYREEAALQCDRSHHRTDVCVAKGDVRVSQARHGGSYQVIVFSTRGQNSVERLKPYTRKWEESVMETIDEVTVISRVIRNGTTDPHLINDGVDGAYPQKNREAQSPAVQKQLRRKRIRARQDDDPLGTVATADRLQDSSGSLRRRSSQKEDKLHAQSRDGQLHQHSKDGDDAPACQVQHEVPGILFSTGGYTGNVYHEFNDGLIPLFITAQQYPAGKVVLIILEYHAWWMSKYADMVAQISDYAVIDLARDKRVHCFPEVTVGLRIHDELAITAGSNPDQASMEGFQSMLRAAYAPADQKEKLEPRSGSRPKMVLMSRSSPRAILNEKELVEMAEGEGFSVQVVKPTAAMKMRDIYRAVRGCEVMVGVHGAGLTHLLFMRGGATLIQVVPLGAEWAAATYYGEPAEKLGLKYVAYRVGTTESSLSEQYGKDDPVLVRPETVNAKGWWETKRIYLEKQDVTVSLRRLQVILRAAYAPAAAMAASS